MSKTSRRTGALERLKAQLKSGKKISKDEETKGQLIELTEKDVKRIEKEISALSK